MPILNDPSHKQVIKSMRERVPEVLGLTGSDRPKAIVLVTAHWETDEVTISSSDKHDLLYDYYGFPPESYKLKYDAPGDAELARKIQNQLLKSGIKAQLDDERGWDHGVFVPMTLINPKADIPIVQVSVLSSQSADELIAFGKALQILRDEGIAILGSGSASFHNLRKWFSGQAASRDFQSRNAAWTNALDEAICDADAESRRKKLLEWRKMPNSYEAHPHYASEHFSPLLVCAGAGGNGTAESWTDEMMGVGMKTYYWS